MIPGLSVNVSDCFSPDYGTARRRFLQRAADAGAAVTTYANPNKGPGGEDLATDVAWFGPDDAENVLVIVSATHGVEGFCGSGAQLDWIARRADYTIPRNTALMLVHAINPYGFAWLRRTTEEGVDLNRNSIDFDTTPLPTNEGYSLLASELVPQTLDDAAFDAADEKLQEWRAAHGETAFETARSSGQYDHPEGIFYGGTAPTWSMQTIGKICQDFRLSERRSVGLIDFHTGLGPYGSGEPICGHKPGTPGQARCRKWYGDSLGEPLLGKSFSLPIAGLTQYAWDRCIGNDSLTFVALEFGTYVPDIGARALRAEHVYHAYYPMDWNSSECQTVKAALRKFYYPDTLDWKELVIARGRQVIQQALCGLAQESEV
ncbi:M14 family metallopeptidase [Komagataeibacter xylinus]|uniref:DUF2817 domain-containing protein n=1 Tax=Komagataeibacter xylinus TaxID=28448 RepID=A0A857FMW6_KOMXY|nr:M14 family metallopeptidase [Komagataeibacter xylinus]QHC35601.1 DUF2817 domain-containing protein [Komagataeibacter xylinus]